MKSIVYILVCLTFPGCVINYPLTTFYVKNNSDKTINFKASILKYSTMGAFEMMLPFTVLPKDSVIARKQNLEKIFHQMNGLCNSLYFLLTAYY